MKNEGDVDLVYARDLLRRINAVVVDGKPLSEKTILQHYNVWQFYQDSLLFGACKEFSRVHNSTPYARSTQPRTFFSIICTALAFVSTILSASWLLLRGPRILVFAPDKLTDRSRQHDFRMSAVYSFLHDERISYAELLHTTFGKTFFTNLRRRKSLRLYLEGLNIPYAIGIRMGMIKKQTSPSFSGDMMRGFSSEEIPFVRSVVLRYMAEIPRTEFRIRALSWILKLSRVRIVFAIDDPRSFYEVTLAARMAGIPTWAFQHGHISKYHVGYLQMPGFTGTMVYPDTLFVWNEYWKQEYIRLGTVFPQSTIVTAGFQQRASTMRFIKKENDTINILIPYETDAPIAEVHTYFNAILSCPRTKIFFKLRPDIPEDIQRARYGITTSSSRVVSGNFAEDVISQIDVVVGVYSTYLYTMVASLKPVAILKTSSDFGDGMIQNGLADRLDLNDRAFCDCVLAIAQTPIATLLARQAKVATCQKPLATILRERLAKHLTR